MVKINLSAMQKNAVDTVNITENNNSIKHKTSLESKLGDINIVQIPKKKMSLNSLISGINDEEILEKEENIVKKSLINNENNFIELSENRKITKEIQVSNVKGEEKSEENKLEKEEVNKLDNNKEEEIKTVNISDGDTIGNLITDINKSEMFVGYVSSFEKEMEILKSKNIKKSDKLEKNKKPDMIDSPAITPVIIENKEINLDKIIEDVKIKEIPVLKEENKKINIDELIKTPLVEEKLNTSLERLNKSIGNTSKLKKNFKISAIIFSLFMLIFTGFFYYMNLDKSIDKNTLKVNISEIYNSVKNKLDDDKISIENIEITEQKINNTTNNEEVKRKLIKYFKNKQNNVKIEVNKN